MHVLEQEPDAQWEADQAGEGGLASVVVLLHHDGVPFLLSLHCHVKKKKGVC